MIKQLGVNLLLFVAMLYLVIQGAYTWRAVTEKRSFEQSPVVYSELIPDREEYYPGDLIQFTFDRTCKVADYQQLPLLMLTVDSFENLETGHVFSGTFASRIVRRSGTEHLNALRRLSDDCTPGSYLFEGWVSIQGAYPVQPVPYSSRKFVVKAKANP